MSVSLESDTESDSDDHADSDHVLSSGHAQIVEHPDDDDDEYLPGAYQLRSLSPPVLAESSGQGKHKIGPLAEALLENNPYLKEPTYLTRPNRWLDAPSTWLSWTESERLAAQSLDLERSQELSIHLLNAHVLKNAESHQRQSQRSRKGKAPATVDEDSGENALERLVLPPSWTSWPMSPDTVPRQGLSGTAHLNVQLGTSADLRVSANLEDCIIATTTRIARRRWMQRDWMPDTPSNHNHYIKADQYEENVSLVSEGVALPSEVDTNGDDDDDQEEPPNSDTDSDSARNESGAEVFTSHVYNFGTEVDTVTDQTSQREQGWIEAKPPVPMTDDERARSLLLPSARQIMSKVDDLLMGMHKARHAYAGMGTAKPRGRSVVKHATGSSEAEATSDTEVSMSGQRKRRRKGSSAASGHSETDVATDQDGRDAGRTRKRLLKPRDWSDVIGMAALTGWEPAVIERASRRCADLFGENMLFRTFHEGDAVRNVQSFYTEEEAANQEEAAEPDDMGGEPQSMIRTSAACERCQSAQRRCEAQDGAEGKGDCKRCISLGLPCSGIKVKVCHNIERTCPYPDCPRYSIPFRKNFQVERHLDQVHRDDPPPREVHSGRNIASEQGDPAPTHEIVCPIQTCQRHAQPFSRGTKLYEHIRKMHPEVDVEQVKKLASARRGESRGRYRDESRRREVGRLNRSRSKSVAAADREYTKMETT